MANKNKIKIIKNHSLNKRIRALLLQLYTDVSRPSAFTSLDPLFREARKKIPSIKRGHVYEFLTTMPVYTKHRQVVRKYKQLATVAPGLHTIWQADLSDMRKIASDNDGNGYFLVCIDCLSRQMFVEKMQRKTATETIRAFQAIFERAKCTPWRIVSDAGREFTGRESQNFFRSLDITHHCMYTSPDWHAGMAERANRTIKERLYRYMTHYQTKRWVDVVQKVVTGINRSPCSSIGNRRPIDVTFKNGVELHRELLNKEIGERSGRRYRQRRFTVGDLVRIEKYKHRFEKGYTGNFTTELFSVCEVRQWPPPFTYRVADSNGEVILGWFYAQDLSLVRVNPPASSSSYHHKQTLEYEEPIWSIEQVLDKKKRKGGVVYCLVKWKGFPTSENSWIPERSIVER
jgi:hypothetical protein